MIWGEGSERRERREEEVGGGRDWDGARVVIFVLLYMREGTLCDE
jgi:hypothetical protein